uniref:Vacuolar fusion protein MON1 homolog n=1 Tax=Cucumis sativus TaxID=3659 RepID=A0A0A0LVI8_CUCSA
MGRGYGQMDPTRKQCHSDPSHQVAKTLSNGLSRSKIKAFHWKTIQVLFPKMSSGLSSLSSSDELDNFNPRTSPSTPPKPLEEELASLALTLPHPQLLSDQDDVNGVSDGFEADSSMFGIQRSDEEMRVGLVSEEHVVGNSVPVVEGATEVSDGAGVVWGRTNSEIEVDRPASPSSSGYAGERGSSSASSGRSETDGVAEDEIQELRDDASVGENSNSVPSWVPGKRHGDEDDASISWRKRKKHFFVLSHSGKPIYSRYGDEHKLAGFSASLQAIISFVEDGGDRVKWVRAGKHQVVFLVKGPIYLVCISCTEEPYESLRGQLELIYGQMILILTKSVNRCFERNPKFDMTSLLGGTDVVFSSLIHSFGWNPATFLHAYTCLPLAYGTRQAAGAILQDVADSGILFAILMCKHKVISIVGAQKASLHPDDMLLLANFVMSTESFRTSESFSPICLPRYNPMAFLYAYVHYFDVSETNISNFIG